MKKGFTLIELLAVIVILAIIAMIATPIVLGIIDDTRKSAFKESANKIIDSLENGFASSMLNGTPIETVYTYENSVEYKNGNIEANYSGSKPETGKMIVKPDGKIEMAIYNGKYCVSKGLADDGVTIEETTSAACLAKLSITYTDASCFTFNSTTKTITDYNFESCPVDVIVPDKINGVVVEHIGPGAFISNKTAQYCDDETWNDEEVALDYVHTDGDGYVNGCWLDLEDWDTQGPLKSIILPSMIKTIDYYAFVNNQLSSLLIPSGVTNIGDSAFYDNSLTSLTLGSGLTNIESYAFNNNKIVNLIIPGNVSSIGTSAFQENPIENLTISNGVTTIGSNSFSGQRSSDGVCAGVLTSVVIPNSVTSLGIASFACNDINSVTLGSGITTIEDRSFEGNDLTSITIPSGVTNIGEYAFGSNKLIGVTIPNSVTMIEYNAFKGNRILQGNAKIDNTSGSVTIQNGAFTDNGPAGTATITPVYLR